MPRRQGPRNISNGAIVIGLVVVISILAPWIVIRLTNSDRPQPASTAPMPGLSTSIATGQPFPSATSVEVARTALADATEPVAISAAESATVQPAATVRPVIPTVQPTPTATPQPSPTATPAPTATPTWTPTQTTVPTVILRLQPTATPTLRPTRRPTRPPTNTPVQVATPVPQPPSAFVSPPALTAPPFGGHATGVVHFSWNPTGPLPAGGGYEVVWWNSDEDSAAARGFQSASTDTSADVNLDSLYKANQFTGSQILWTVLVVQLEPYVRWMQPSEGEPGTFFYEAPKNEAPPAQPQPTPPLPPR